MAPATARHRRAPALAARPRDVVAGLRAARLVLATAESCTGGLLAAAVTGVPGSSAVFKGGIVAYADDAKEGLLGVSKATLGAEGAVSRGCAAAMARGARRRLGADVGVALTGIAGPGGAVPGKPVGTVWFALDDGRSVHAEVRRFAGSRAQVRKAAVTHALRLVLDHLSALR